MSRQKLFLCRQMLKDKFNFHQHKLSKAIVLKKLCCKTFQFNISVFYFLFFWWEVSVFPHSKWVKSQKQGKSPLILIMRELSLLKLKIMTSQSQHTQKKNKKPSEKEKIFLSFLIQSWRKDAKIHKKVINKKESFMKKNKKTTWKEIWLSFKTFNNCLRKTNELNVWYASNKPKVQKLHK